MGVTFSKEAAKRIGRATIAEERRAKNTTPPQRRKAVPTEEGFWAVITDGTGGTYSWERIQPKAEADLLLLVPAYEQPENYPKGEYSDPVGYAISWDASPYVLDNSLVWLQPSYDENYYTFKYQPDMMTAKLPAGEIITARTGSTPGSGEVIIENVDAIADKLVDGQTIKVFNSMRSEVEAEDDDLAVHIEYGQGVWWVIGTDCVTDSTSGSPGGS